MTRARTVEAIFTDLPSKPPAPTPPPTTTTTPTPPATAGHYAGDTSGGNHVQLDVGSDQQSLTRIFFDSVNGKCNLDYGSTIGGLSLSGSIPINPDGTFSATFQGSGTQNGQPDSETGSLQGRFTGASAAGSVTLNTDFYTEDGLHLTCSGTETWTAVLTP